MSISLFICDASFIKPCLYHEGLELVLGHFEFSKILKFCLIDQLNAIIHVDNKV